MFASKKDCARTGSNPEILNERNTRICACSCLLPASFSNIRFYLRSLLFDKRVVPLSVMLIMANPLRVLLEPDIVLLLLEIRQECSQLYFLKHH